MTNRNQTLSYGLSKQRNEGTKKMTMFNRFAVDLSEPLFNSVYGELYEFAERAQKGAKRGTITEEQETLNRFCKGKISLGEALNFIQTKKAYQVPLTQY
ncbi:hypothetical protein HUU40_00110 [candidate division KSB1 bacterium]|nr:hypothetical protein [candidate division KSB1 bacterium]